MKIGAVRITGYRSLVTTNHWGRPIGDANGAVRSGITPVPILLIETDVGVTGVGLGDHSQIDKVFPAIDGEDPRAVPALFDRMLAAVFKAGHQGAVYGAIGAVDMALWDLKAKLAGEPLWRLLGARDRTVPAYASGLDIVLDDDELAAVYAEFAGRGLRAGKLKGGLDPVVDARRLAIVTDALAINGSPALMLDANESWWPKQAVRHVAALEQHFDLTWIEEPVRRWDAVGLAAVRSQVRAAVATGENLTGVEQFVPLIRAGAVDVVQTGSVWGITHFLRVAALAHAHDLPVSVVGYNTNPLAAAAAAVPNHLTLEVQDLGTPRGLTVDHAVTDGCVVLGDEPGSGLTVDEAALEPPTTDQRWTDDGGPHVRPADAGRRLFPRGLP